MHCFSEQSRFMELIVMAAELKHEYLKLSDLIEIVKFSNSLIKNVQHTCPTKLDFVRPYTQ